MAHKLSQDTVNEGIAFIMSKEGSKERKFKESIELQVGLKDYDTQKDKRFAGSQKMPNMVRPKLKICLIGDAKHGMEHKSNNVDIDFIDLDELKKFNKEKKPIKKWAKQYALLIATDVLVKKIPVVLGPILNRIGRFPQIATHNEPLQVQVDSIRSTVKFQLKKVTCLACAIGTADMDEDQIRQNLLLSLNFLVSLLKKGWHNLKSVNIKTTMGKPFRLI